MDPLRVQWLLERLGLSAAAASGAAWTVQASLALQAGWWSVFGSYAANMGALLALAWLLGPDDPWGSA